MTSERRRVEASLHCLCDLSIVAAPEIEIIGDDYTYHKLDTAYRDLGARAYVFLSDHTYMEVPVKIVKNDMPSLCDALGKYVVQYEAVGPHGFISRVQRIVEIGEFKLFLSNVSLTFRNRSLFRA